jgi:hypothetical protein
MATRAGLSVHWRARLPGEPGGPGRIVHAGVDGEDIDQAGEGKDPEHLLLRRG